jgi:hypothetical protein
VKVSKKLPVKVSWGRTQTFVRFCRFWHEENSVDHRNCTGRASPDSTDRNLEKVREILNEDRRTTTSEIAVRLGLSCRTCGRSPQSLGFSCSPTSRSSVFDLNSVFWKAARDTFHILHFSPASCKVLPRRCKYFC